MNTYRNCKDVYFIDHGDRADPELYYNGEYYNCWLIEDTLWYEFLDENYLILERDDIIEDEIEEKFNKYVQEHIYDYLI